MSAAPPMLPRGGARPARRPKRLAIYHEAGARALAAEVVVQAIGEVREGIAAGWIKPDGSLTATELQPHGWPQRASIEERRAYQRQRRKINVRVRVAQAAEFLKDKAQLNFWLQLAAWPDSAAEFTRKFWRQMKKEAGHAA